MTGMQSTGGRRFWSLITASLFITAGAVRGQPYRVCAFGFNSADELRVIRAHLPPDQFDFIDLSGELLAAENTHLARAAAATGAAQTRQDGARTWLLSLCDTDLQCDISFYSGEFAGGFFGRYGSDLNLEEMEEAACQPRCDGLFHHEQEVFLLGCNTLATKSHDNRTPQQYREVLLSHGFDRAAAERVVELRYGALGPSFRESIQRIFLGVPRIYGFASVAPRGTTTAPRLAKYFSGTGDYARYLQRAWDGTQPNRKILAAFHGTGLVQAAGMRAGDAHVTDRQAVCAVYDDRRTLAQRLRTVRDLLARPDFLSFLPSAEVFFRRQVPLRLSPDERRVAADIEANVAARSRILALLPRLDAPLLQLQLAEMVQQVGWITADELRRLAINDVRQLLREPTTTDVVDGICEVTARQRIGDAFRSEDFPDRLFRDADGLRMVQCVAPADARINIRLAGALEDPDVWTRRWAAYALSQRLPLDAASLHQMARHLDDSNSEVRDRLHWVLRGATANGAAPAAANLPRAASLRAGP